MSSVISKIRKLLALAEGSEGNEAEVAASMARRLMDEHAIAQSHLDEAEILESDPVGTHSFEVGLNSQWRMKLAWAIASHCGVTAIRATAWRGGKRVVDAIGYGHRSDLEVWEYLYKVAAREIDKKTKEERKCAPYDWDTGKVDRKYMNRYRLGLVQGLSMRLRADRRKEDTKRSQEEGLVIQSRAARGRDACDKANPNLGTFNSSLRGNRAGTRDGFSININGALTAKPSDHKRLKG